jgi:hypothetical protein
VAAAVIFLALLAFAKAFTQLLAVLKPFLVAVFLFYVTQFGAKTVGIAPRIYLKKLVADVLDRVDQFPDIDPLAHYTLTLAETELTPVEREAAGAQRVDDISLDIH